MSELGGTDVPRDEEDSRPASVFVAVLAAYSLAAALVLFGLIGFLVSNALDDSVGAGAFLLGLIVAGAAYVASRGSSLGPRLHRPGLGRHGGRRRYLRVHGPELGDAPVPADGRTGGRHVRAPVPDGRRKALLRHELSSASLGRCSSRLSLPL